MDIADNGIKQLDLTDISRTLQPTKAKYTFFPSAYEYSPGWTTFRTIKQTKSFKRIEIIQNILSDYKKLL